MSKNIQQVFVANPTTSMPGTALLYAGLAPFGLTDDTAITWSNLQASISTVGTITSGTWHGSVITGTYGGTGINNGSSTITIGGSVSFVGAFTFDGTLTANTAVTFPTSGTLATTSQIPTLPVSLANGGTGASLTANNGGIFYSTATSGAILSGTATANQVLLSGSTAAPAWSTATYPATTTINRIIYSSANNTISEITTANDGVLITSAGGVPSISSTLPAAVQGNITSLGTITSGVWNGTVIAGTYGGTGVNNGSSTITIGGSVTFSGAFTFTGTLTGNTGVTFPTSGTLATTSQIPTLPLSLANGGTNASLTASNGGIFYSTATAGAILSGTATANQILLSGSSTTPAWSTATYPATTTVSQLLYSSATNTISGLATTNRASLSTNATGVPAWLALTDGQIVVGSTAGAPAAATLTAGANISISNASNSITVAATGAASFSWSEVTGTSQSAAVNRGYIANNAGLVTVTLPATAALGDMVSVQGKGAGLWALAANTGQTVKIGTSTTTSGGSLTATAQFDSIEVVCITANTTWATRFVVSSGLTVT